MAIHSLPRRSVPPRADSADLPRPRERSRNTRLVRVWAKFEPRAVDRRRAAARGEPARGDRQRHRFGEVRRPARVDVRRHCGERGGASHASLFVIVVVRGVHLPLVVFDHLHRLGAGEGASSACPPARLVPPRRSPRCARRISRREARGARPTRTIGSSLLRAREERAAAGSSVGEFPVGDSRSAEIRFRDGHQLGALLGGEEVIEHEQQGRFADELHGRLGGAEWRRGEITERGARGPRATRGARGEACVFARRRPRRRIPSPDSNRDAIRGDPPRRNETRRPTPPSRNETRRPTPPPTPPPRLRRLRCCGTPPRREGRSAANRTTRNGCLRTSSTPARPTARGWVCVCDEAFVFGWGRTRTRLRVVETPRERVRHRHLHPSARASEPPSDAARLVAARTRRERRERARQILRRDVLDVGTSRGAATEPECVAYGRVPGPGDVRGSIHGGGDVVERVGFFLGRRRLASEHARSTSTSGSTRRARAGRSHPFDVAANDGETETDVDRPGLARASRSRTRGDVEVSVSDSLRASAATLEVERTRIRGEVLRLPEESPVERVELETRRRPRRANRARSLGRVSSGRIGDEDGDGRDGRGG